MQGWPQPAQSGRAGVWEHLDITPKQPLTFLHGGVQLCHLDDQQVHPLLQGVHPHVEAVGFVEELSKDVLCVPAWQGTTRLSPQRVAPPAQPIPWATPLPTGSVGCSPSLDFWEPSPILSQSAAEPKGAPLCSESNTQRSTEHSRCPKEPLDLSAKKMNITQHNLGKFSPGRKPRAGRAVGTVPQHENLQFVPFCQCFSCISQCIPTDYLFRVIYLGLFSFLLGLFL